MRVIRLRWAGSVETMPDVLERHATRTVLTRDEFVSFLADKTLLERLPPLADVAGVAALTAWDHAGAITGAVPDVTCGGWSTDGRRRRAGAGPRPDRIVRPPS
ncbi:hypothetical protein [Streptomyces sp. NPDC002133]|uniref:hypothetical protein n=1 Tax=Streptomyces sp. NPDC002133 TaxID=3154409 RepID=UPI003333F1B0